MPVNKKKIFLAGATGLAGSSIIQCLLDDFPGAAIRAGYNNTEPFIRDPRVNYVQGDLTSLEDCKRMVKGCDYAIMAAAFTGGAGLVKSFPLEHVMQNLAINMRMLEAFRDAGVKRFVYVGSATLYQDFDGFIKEDQLDLNCDPSMVYLGFGWIVRFVEKMCRFWHENFGMEAVIVRSSNIFGPYAKFDPLTSNFIPALIRKAVDRMDPFEVWGSPDVVRDVIYCEDFARAIGMLLDEDTIKFDTFNIGSGVKTTIGDVLGWALKYSGHSPLRVEYDSSKPGTMKFRALDCSKIKEAIGWTPQYSVEEGVKRTTLWYKKNRSWWKK